ncbi:MAG: protein kinase [[Bacteroides] pectinophilus]|nr:protein kinase [[Bacteroides] pectinophilus]
MISEDSLKQISHIFCGDEGEFYIYKSGSKLVGFFNKYYGTSDKYGQGFPSRWIYVYDKLVDLINNNKFDGFLNLILSKQYLMTEKSITQVEAAGLSEAILKELNKIVERDQCKITTSNGKFHLVRENDDLVLIGSGGFANVYRQKSTGIIIKKLKEDFLTDRGIRSRFKREYNITKSLQGTFGIIDVYTFDEGACSYTMEPAETTLEKYIANNDVSEQIKITCIRQILHVMTEVHNKDIIHRDLSPNNIFIMAGVIKIADFGLGKDLNVFTSHQTMHTNAMGQYYYCAPEQFMMLCEGDKRSDVYSLGRVINYIMTTDPRNSHHAFRSVSEKATNGDASYRYADAGQLSNFFEKAVTYRSQAENQERIDVKIKGRKFDDEIESYIYNLTNEEIAKRMQSYTNGFADMLFQFMKLDDSHAEFVIQSIDKAYQIVGGRNFESYDVYATFAKRILLDNFTFVVKEIAANILRYVAWDVNRFDAQHMVEDVINVGIDPMLEDIISS